MAKGDKITVGVRAGEAVVPISLEASQNGRKVAYAFEKEGGLNWIVVQETTRGGTVVWEDRFDVASVAYLRKQVKEI